MKILKTEFNSMDDLNNFVSMHVHRADIINIQQIKNSVADIKYILFHYKPTINL